MLGSLDEAGLPEHAAATNLADTRQPRAKDTLFGFSLSFRSSHTFLKARPSRAGQYGDFHRWTGESDWLNDAFVCMPVAHYWAVGSETRCFLDTQEMDQGRALAGPLRSQRQSGETRFPTERASVGARGLPKGVIFHQKVVMDCLD